MAKIFNKVTKESDALGVIIKTAKTKMLISSRNNSPLDNNKEHKETMHRFKYLGSW